MSLSEFLTFSQQCPICGESLNLYMQWINFTCFKATLLEPNLYQFDPFLRNNMVLQQVEDDDYMLLKNNGDTIETQMSSSKILQEAKKYHIYFFYLCNPLGFQKKKYGDYQINLYKGCYYRDSAIMEFQRNEDQDNKSWKLTYLDKDHKHLSNKCESFSFKRTLNNIERVYMLDLNYDQKVTTIWHYSVTEEEKKIESFEPKIFEKKMPLLKNRPRLGLEDRDKLIDRFDSWIIMS